VAIHVLRGRSDQTIDRIIEALRAYEADHPRAQIDLYRQNSVSVRVRIVDPDFAGRNKVERSKIVWNYLRNLPEDVQADISMLVLLVPDETAMSFANLDFEDPIPSSL
jgi:stress-induced morphogen